MFLGLTGGIGSGKSTVARKLVELGAVLIDADIIAREVVQPGELAYQEIIQLFGTEVLSSDDSINRSKLGEIIFTDPHKRKLLEQIIHPRVRARMKQLMEQYHQINPKQLIVVDIPLLYESELQSMFEQVILVYVPTHIQIERVMHRNQLTEEETRKRVEAQASLDWKKSLANIIIDNSDTLNHTYQQVEKAYNELSKSSL